MFFLDLMMATFLIKSLFKLTGRGSVLAGDIVDGKISGGDSIQVLPDKRPIKINSVEYVDYGKGRAEIGLMLGIVDENTVNILETAIGQTVVIVESY